MATTTAPVSQKAQARLDYVRTLTDRIRGYQDDIATTAEDRRQVIVSLREERITYREIAEAMGVTEQNVYKILKDYIANSPKDEE